MSSWHNSKEWHRTREAHIRREPFCAVCGNSMDLEVHHLNSGKYFPLLRYEESNLITLCRDCHREAYHEGFKGGYQKKATIEDFNRFMFVVKYGSLYVPQSIALSFEAREIIV